MVMKKTSVAIPLSGRVPGRASGPSRSRVDDGGRSRCVSGKVIGSLGFIRRGVFMGLFGSRPSQPRQNWYAKKLANDLAARTSPSPRRRN
jgi:hypothetical protein